MKYTLARLIHIARRAKPGVFLFHQFESDKFLWIQIKCRARRNKFQFVIFICLLLGLHDGIRKINGTQTRDASTVLIS